MKHLPPSREDFERVVRRLRSTLPQIKGTRTEERIGDETHLLFALSLSEGEEVIVGWSPREFFVSSTDQEEDVVSPEWERAAGEALRRVRAKYAARGVPLTEDLAAEFDVRVDEKGNTAKETPETSFSPPTIGATVEIDAEVQALISMVQERWATRYGAGADLSAETIVRVAVVGLFGSTVLAPLAAATVAASGAPSGKTNALPRRGVSTVRERRAKVRSAIEAALARLVREMNAETDEILISAHYAPLRRLLSRSIRTNELSAHLSAITRATELKTEDGTRFRLTRAGEQYFHAQTGDTFMTWALTRLDARAA